MKLLRLSSWNWTNLLSIPLRMKLCRIFQTNTYNKRALSIPLRMKRWNFITKSITKSTFNSFEDETEDRDRSRGEEGIGTFNSFEDETINEGSMEAFAKNILSIPLRMKLNPGSFPEGADYNVLLSIPLRMKLYTPIYVLTSTLFFQFLWGWNRFSETWPWSDIIFFQFLWGWNVGV